MRALCTQSAGGFRKAGRLHLQTVISPLVMPQKMNKSRKNRTVKRRTANMRLNPFGAVPVPSAYVTRMGYMDLKTVLEGVAGAGGFRSYNLTSVYDPDVTGVGTQPVSFDQWSNLYGRFRVVEADVSLECLNRGDAAAATSVCGYFISTASTLPASPFSWACQRYGSSHSIGNASGFGKVVFRFRVKPWLPFSLTKQQYLNDMDFSGTFSAGPIRPLYLHLWVLGAGAIASVDFNIRIGYHVELSEPTANTVS